MLRLTEDTGALPYAPAGNSPQHDFSCISPLIVFANVLSIGFEIKLTRYLHINGFQSHIPLLSQPHKERGRVMKQGVEKGSRLRANQEGAVGNRAGRKRPQHYRSWRSRRFDKESNVALLACLESVKFRRMWCVGLGTVGLWLVA